MYIIKNATKNLLRNKNRNILTGILLFFMLSAICISVVIESASRKMSEIYKEQFKITATLKVDFQSLIGTAQSFVLDYPDLTAEDFKKYADSDYVNDYITFGSNGMFAPNVIAVGTENESNSFGGLQIEDGGRSQQYYSANLSLYGYSDVMLLTDFLEGYRKITSGTIFSTLNECVISEELAKKNDLKVGDSILLQTTEKADSESLTLTISGIYSDIRPSNAFVFETTQLSANDVIVNFDTIAQLSSEKYAVDGSFVLSDPSRIDAFTKELKDKGLPEAYYISSNSEDYLQAIAPAEGLSSIVRVFMIIVLVLGGGILLFLSLIAVRDRKYEIGILRARGMTKCKIAAQFLTENLMLVLICLVLSLSAGVTSAQMVSDKLLEGELTKIEQQEKNRTDQLSDMFSMDLTRTQNFGEDSENVAPITKVEVNITLENIITITLISLMLCVFTSTVSVIYISKREPMRILMERN